MFRMGFGFLRLIFSCSASIISSRISTSVSEKGRSYSAINCLSLEDTHVTPKQPWRQVSIDGIIDGAGPLLPGTAPLPAALRGVFWLGGQTEGSALATFGSNNNVDGAWCSHGQLIGNWLRVRVTGDRTWSFATQNTGGDLAHGLDLVYNFEFNDASNPESATIYPVSNELDFTLTQTWALKFEMELVPPDSDEAKELGFEGSVVWKRTSYVWGVLAADSTYYFTQVVDEHGTRIEPAWTQFVTYQNSEDAGDSPGVMHYFSEQPFEEYNCLSKELWSEEKTTWCCTNQDLGCGV